MDAFSGDTARVVTADVSYNIIEVVSKVAPAVLGGTLARLVDIENTATSIMPICKKS